MKNVKGGKPMDIKRIRRKALMTQTEFAKAIGVSLCAVQCWEQKVNKPSFRNLRKILDFCKKREIKITL